MGAVRRSAAMEKSTMRMCGWKSRRRAAGADGGRAGPAHHHGPALNFPQALAESDHDVETMASSTARTAKRTSPRKQAPKSADRDKSTIVMSGSEDFRLGAIAASLRMDRSALAAKLIDEGLRRYALDGVLRQFSDRQESSAQINLAEPSAA
jgi:hypothetical protein